MTDRAPDDIQALAEARSAARAGGDWTEADRIRAEIEAAGWKVVDRGTRFQLSPAVPADVVETDRVRYGSSGSVPSRLDEPATHAATVIVRISDRPDDLARLLDGLRGSAPDRTQVVVVADAPSETLAVALADPAGPAAGPVAGEPPVVVWTAHRLGPAGGVNAGVRQSTGAVIVLLDPGLAPTGDVVTPLVRALDDPGLAVVGAWGSVSTDVRRWTAAAPGDVDAIDAAAMAFRRSDFVARGPLDEGFRTASHLATWWSLVLRDEGEGATPRRARRLADLPLDPPAPSPDPRAGGEAAARKAKRDAYRVLDRFGRRLDLVSGMRAS